MKDFPFWRKKLLAAKSFPALKVVGEELNRFQNQPDLLGGQAKLKIDQLKALRTIYSNQKAKLEAESNETPDNLKGMPDQADSVLAKTCIQCGKPIPLDRLEAVPNAQRCVPCQDQKESGKVDPPKPVLCKKCKSVMVWRMTKNKRPAKYFLGCSNYPKCTYVGVSSF